MFNLEQTEVFRPLLAMPKRHGTCVTYVHTATVSTTGFFLDFFLTHVSFDTIFQNH
jgi:hypothetical protein